MRMFLYSHKGVKEEMRMSPVRTFASPRRLGAMGSGAINRRVVRALLNLISAALLLRIGGMVNQVVVSADFGAGAAMDAYFVATAFPLLLVQLLSSALEAAVIPVYSRLRLSSDLEAASRLLSTLLNGLILATGLLVLVLLWLRQPLIFLSAPGLDSDRQQQAVILASLLDLALPLSLVIGLLEAVLNAEGQFGWPAYAGLLVPLTTALLTLVGGKTWGITILCFGSLLGTSLQLIVVGVRSRRAGLRYRLVLDVSNPDLRLILCAVWPVLLGALITQAGPLVDQIFASTLPTGSISALNYALKLVSILIGVIFVSAGRAVLPYLARQAALGDPNYHAFKGTLRLYLWGVGFCTLILSLLLLLLGRPCVAILFQHGAFSAADTIQTVIILSGFLPGLVPMASNFLLSRAFNALGETRIPMYMALVSIGANAFFDLLFAHFWQGLGIALATSTVSLVTSLLLLILLRRRIGPLQIWYIPPEFHTFVDRFRSSRMQRCLKSWKNWLGRSFYTRNYRQGLLFLGVTLVALLISVLATLHDALVTLRICLGLSLLLSSLRYPFVLLLAWASLDVCIGSSLAFFNGNNLDLLLILPLLCLLPILPWKRIIRRMPSLCWLTLFLGWVLLGLNLSPLAPGAFLTLWLSILASSVGVSALTVTLITTRRRFLGLIDALLITALLVALYGLYGFVTRQNGEIDPETLLFRATSWFTQATTCAFYLCPVIFLAFYRCFFARGILRPIYILVALCLLGMLLLTFTRSAYICVFLGTLLMALCLPSARTRLRVVCGLLLLCSGMLYAGWSVHQPLLARFFSGNVATLNGRLYLWQALLSNFQVTSWLGSGLQSSDQLLAYLHVGIAGRGVIGTAPHSLFLGTLYDHGIIGLLLLSMAFLFSCSGLLRGIGKSGGERRMLCATALASMVSMLLQSVVSRDLWIQAAGASFWIIVSLPFARYWWNSEETLTGEYQGGGTGLQAERSPGSESPALCQLQRHMEGEV